MIEVQGLNYVRGNKTILKDISYTFEQGKTYGIIGPNGAGKSTLLRHLMQLIKPAKGTIYFEGKDIRVFTTKEYARKISFVFQENIRDIGFNVYEVLRMGKYTHMDTWGSLSQADEQEIEQILDELDIRRFKDRAIGSLSGGEAQKVFIGRALLQDTPVLLLDEPTSMLDVHNGIELMALILDLQQRRNLTVIMVLHDLNLAMNYCEELLLLQNGALVAAMPPLELVKDSRLSEVYHGRLKVIKDEEKHYIVPFI